MSVGDLYLKITMIIGGVAQSCDQSSYFYYGESTNWELYRLYLNNANKNRGMFEFVIGAGVMHTSVRMWFQLEL